MIRLIAVIIIGIVVVSCTILMSSSDHNNPCAGNRDSLECEKWKKKFPREYKNYKRRTK